MENQGARLGLIDTGDLGRPGFCPHSRKNRQEKWPPPPVASHVSAGGAERRQRPGGERPEGRGRGEQRVYAVETGQDLMMIGARAVGNAPARMENAVNVAANPASVAAHSIARSLSSALTRTATAS
ncbi:MAG: hypothetical protein CM1200mP29_07530 [Verrucomicrobiota bacterium]|nr:MAG: hypothetical protein CM1200mP29_07530 [Verrucomicrobiota bacterium]